MRASFGGKQREGPGVGAAAVESEDEKDLWRKGGNGVCVGSENVVVVGRRRKNVGVSGNRRQLEPIYDPKPPPPKKSESNPLVQRGRKKSDDDSRTNYYTRAHILATLRYCGTAAASTHCTVISRWTCDPAAMPCVSAWQ